MAKPKQKNPKEARVTLGEDYRNKLEAMSPDLHITSQIREAIEYSYNTKFLGVVDAVEMNRYGGGEDYPITFVTEEARNKVEDGAFLCESIEFYPYAGYFDMKVKLSGAFYNIEKIISSKALEALLKNTRIRKSYIDSEKWELDNSHSGVFYGVYKKPEFEDLYRSLSYKAYSEYHKIYDAISTSEKKIIKALCNPAKTYREWHQENFRSLIEEKLQEKNGITYEAIIAVLVNEGKSYMNSHIEKYKSLTTKYESSMDSNPELSKELNQTKKMLLDYLDHIFDDEDKEVKTAFLGDIRLIFKNKNKQIQEEVTQELNKINSQIKKLKEYSKTTFSVRIKPATFTIID